MPESYAIGLTHRQSILPSITAYFSGKIESIKSACLAWSMSAKLITINNCEPHELSDSREELKPLMATDCCMCMCVCAHYIDQTESVRLNRRENFVECEWMLTGCFVRLSLLHFSAWSEECQLQNETARISVVCVCVPLSVLSSGCLNAFLPFHIRQNLRMFDERWRVDCVRRVAEALSSAPMVAVCSMVSREGKCSGVFGSNFCVSRSRH